MDPPTTKILMDVVITLYTEVIQQLEEDLTFHKLTGNGGGKLTHRYIVSLRIILYQSYHLSKLSILVLWLIIFLDIVGGTKKKGCDQKRV